MPPGVGVLPTSAGARLVGEGPAISVGVRVGDTIPDGAGVPGNTAVGVGIGGVGILVGSGGKGVMVGKGSTVEVAVAVAVGNGAETNGPREMTFPTIRPTATTSVADSTISRNLVR